MPAGGQFLPGSPAQVFQQGNPGVAQDVYKRQVFDSFTAYKNGQFVSGRTNYGIETQSAIFDDRDYNKLPEDVKTDLDKLIEDVKSGSLKLEDLLK